ncbi:MAG: hypothetical protein HRT37_21495 [Alteromonadaceae bacterium]|nr:hypothetical protein [Alteromonadaceae bacterium]
MKVNILVAVLLLMLIWCGFGCSIQAQEKPFTEVTATEVPALVSHFSDESHVEIQNTIAILLKQKQVLIADNAFTDSSYISLERAAHKTDSGQLIMGKSMELPFNLQLVIKGDSCFIKDENSGKSLALSITQCKVE